MNGLHNQKTTFIALLIACALLGLNACSISNSAGSASGSAGSLAKSSESISDSSTSSSGGETSEKKAEDNRYSEEARDYTVTYLRANADNFDKNAFMKGLSEVAAEHGINDWEANPKTYRAIGKGLRQARISGQQYDDYKLQLSDGDAGKQADIQQGYDN